MSSNRVKLKVTQVNVIEYHQANAVYVNVLEAFINQTHVGVSF